VKELIKNQEKGAAFVHAAVNWGDKAVLTTRSDGKDSIAIRCLELQAEWERLVRKLSDAKVSTLAKHMQNSLFVVIMSLYVHDQPQQQSGINSYNRFKWKQLFCNGPTTVRLTHSWRSGYQRKKPPWKNSRRKR
jgi:hypothetical protein